MTLALAIGGDGRWSQRIAAADKAPTSAIIAPTRKMLDPVIGSPVHVLSERIGLGHRLP
jgi:hypothetical protein